MTCLMLAARDGHSKVINLLVSHGAAINVQDANGYTVSANLVKKYVFDALFIDSLLIQISRYKSLCCLILAADLNGSKLFFFCFFNRMM